MRALRCVNDDENVPREYRETGGGGMTPGEKPWRSRRTSDERVRF